MIILDPETRKDIQTQIDCLLAVVRSIAIKRALTEVNPTPESGFWRFIYGAMLDVAVIEWCKVFGANDQPTHWKKMIQEKEKFRNELFSFLKINKEVWSKYWGKMKYYRNNYAAHNLGWKKGDKYPVLDLALQSCFFYYPKLVEFEKNFADIRRPASLADHYADFYNEALKKTKQALHATNEV